MKKFILALVAMFTMTFSTANAMSYEQARQQALFLTDKMAYELNLTDDQYEAAYEVNLDYLMGVNTYDDLYGAYWRQRNMDLSYILLDWQYRAYLNAAYFYRPLYWDGGYWHFGIYARYPHRDYFFYGRPHFYAVYHGGHSWRMNGGRSWYSGRQFGGPRPGGQPRVGMRDGFNRGDFGRGQTFGNLQRQSSTRTTVTRDRNFGNGRPSGFGNGSRPSGFDNGNRPSGFGNSRPSSTDNGAFGNSNRSNSNIFGGNRGSFGTNRGGFGNSNRSTFGSGSTNSRPSNGGFTPRSTTPSNGSFGSRSFGGSNSRGGGFGGGSFGGGSSTRSSGGNAGGGHFGGHR